MKQATHAATENLAVWTASRTTKSALLYSLLRMGGSMQKMESLESRAQTFNLNLNGANPNRLDPGEECGAVT